MPRVARRGREEDWGRLHGDRRRRTPPAAVGRGDRRADRLGGHGAEACGRREAAGGGALRRVRLQPHADPARCSSCSPSAASSRFIPIAAHSSPAPSAEEARDVFEARRAIERSIVLSAAARIERGGARGASRQRARGRRGGSARATAASRSGCRASFIFASPEAAGNSRAGEVPRRPRRAHISDHRPLRLAQRALVLRRRARGADRRARPTRRRARGRHDGGSPQPHRTARSTSASAVSEPVDIRRVFGG